MAPDLPISHDLAYRFDALYQWLSRKYPLELVELTIGDQAFQLYKISQIDDLLDEIVNLQENPDDHTPYWTELWPSSIGMAHFLRQRGSLEGKITLELGCGLGLVGIVAGHLGASVVLSDIEEDALRIAALNWIINFHQEPQTVQLDWRQPELNQQFDLLIASDVAYEKRLFYPLIEAFKCLLKPEGIIYLSEPNRRIAEEFFVLLKTEGFHFNKSSQTIHYRQRDMEISVYQISRIR